MSHYKHISTCHSWVTEITCANHELFFQMTFFKKWVAYCGSDIWKEVKIGQRLTMNHNWVNAKTVQLDH